MQAVRGQCWPGTLEKLHGGAEYDESVVYGLPGAILVICGRGGLFVDGPGPARLLTHLADATLLQPRLRERGILKQVHSLQVQN